MASHCYRSALIILSLLAVSAVAAPLPPEDFVYLREVAPSVHQDIRYATPHNFIGKPIHGYQAAECILTRRAAEALAKVQQELSQSGLSLKVFDCYRPQMAVDEFIAWSQNPKDQAMKQEFYPRVNKADFFTLGYVAAKSGHSRGSTVDLTIVPLNAAAPKSYKNGQTLRSCIGPYLQRFPDAGVDMGTGFDCMDELSHNDSEAVNTVAFYHRLMLQKLMEKYGFNPLQEEWWHFTLKNEPFPQTYFNFPITKKTKT
jgi:zinc D-Ala-D-Ala dipeptidase